MIQRIPRLRDLLLELLQTALRLAPWPTEPGLRSVGSPGPSSPVLITCNYALTVRRLMRALRGVDAWVVVAHSAGVNVWCAASGGLFTTHQVVSALKTSGIEQKVRHHRAILPQLAATGVLAREVSRRCGWKVRFGPVYARDIPRYLASGQKSPDMRVVRFGVVERLEMCAAWAIPTALVVGAGAALLHPAWAWPLVGLALALALVVFFVYERIPGPRRLVVASAATAAAVVLVGLSDGGPSAFVGAGVASVALTGLLTYDYSGSTPIEGGSHFEERQYAITLEPDRCEGVRSCLQVCPEGVYEEQSGVKQIRLAHDERCIRCGACIVQCPQDALFFESADGRRIGPDVLRRFKLNLLGRRTVEARP